MNNIQTGKPEIDQLISDSATLKEWHGDIKAMKGQLDSIKTAASTLCARLLLDNAKETVSTVKYSDESFTAVLKTYDKDIRAHNKNPRKFSPSFGVAGTFKNYVDEATALLGEATSFLDVAKPSAALAQSLQPNKAKDQSRFDSAKLQLALSMQQFETQTQSLSQKLSADTTQPAPAFNPATQPDERELFASC